VVVEVVTGVGGALTVALLAPHVELSSTDQAGRLFLRKQQFRELPFASRMFRPPRE
jgi:hypothetical protein